jgi:hypothetical protein
MKIKAILRASATLALCAPTFAIAQEGARQPLRLGD